MLTRVYTVYYSLNRVFSKIPTIHGIKRQGKCSYVPRVIGVLNFGIYFRLLVFGVLVCITVTKKRRIWCVQSSGMERSCAEYWCRVVGLQSSSVQRRALWSYGSLDGWGMKNPLCRVLMCGRVAEFCMVCAGLHVCRVLLCRNIICRAREQEHNKTGF